MAARKTAEMLAKLAEGHAKVVGHTVLFTDPQVDAGLDYINKIGVILSDSSLKHSNPAEYAQLEVLLQDALLHLDNDQKLAESMQKANNVLLGMFFELGEPQGRPDSALPDYVLKNNLLGIQGGEEAALPIPSMNALVPIPVLGSTALALGHPDTRRLFISRGIGYTWRARLAARPECVEITLTGQ